VLLDIRNHFSQLINPVWGGTAGITLNSLQHSLPLTKTCRLLMFRLKLAYNHNMVMD